MEGARRNRNTKTEHSNRILSWWEHAKPYDVILTWPQWENHDLATFIISGAISLFTGWGPTHVMLMVGPSLIWEVTYPYTRFAPASLWNVEDYDIEIGYHKDFSLDKHALKILNTITELTGTPYDVGELFWHALDELGIYSMDKSSPHRWVCSSGINYAFTQAGIPFSTEQLVSPANIRSSKYYKTRWRSWNV